MHIFCIENTKFTKILVVKKVLEVEMTVINFLLCRYTFD